MQLKDCLPLIYAIVGVFLGFFLNQLFVYHRDRKLRYQKLLSLLKATEAEVHFYLIKLKEFHKKAFIEKTFEAKVIGGRVLIFRPTYMFFPRFLEDLKSNLVEYPETSELVKVVGTLHFDLIHVQARLEQTVSDSKDPQLHDDWIMLFNRNVTGFGELVEKCLNSFGDAQKEIEARVSALEKEEASFLEISPFNFMLKD